MAEHALLCRADPALVGHVEQLLADAAVPATTAAEPDGLVAVSVPVADEERARSVIGLVLPQLLVESPGPGSLSDRLVRSDEPELPGGLTDGRRSFGYADPLADSPDGGQPDEFVPPHPPPLPRPRDRIARAAWTGVIGGPVLLLLTVVFGLPKILTTVGLIAFFAGFGLLVYRHEGRDRDGDGWDDGAVV